MRFSRVSRTTTPSAAPSAPLLAAILLLLAAAHGRAQEMPLGALAGPPERCTADDPRVELLLLGSYHMANPGQDAFNLEADDVRTPERQAEIEALVARLARFRPTRVAIEAAHADSADWLDAYRAYRAGDRELRPNEREQIGFRLADQMGHERIYPIDVMMPLDDSALGRLAGQNPAHGERLAGLQAFGQEAMRIMADWLAEGTVSDMLYRMNQPEALRLAHSLYGRYFVPIVEGEDYAGADMVATWYQRNLRILANIHRAIESDDDRVLVVYGQGHIPLLRQLAIDSPELCLIDPLPFLVD